MSHAAARDESGVAVLLGRRPMFGPDLETTAYRLLYAGAPEPGGAERMTAEIVVRAMVDFGIERICEDKPAVITFPRPFLVGDLPMPVPRHKVVVRVAPDVEPDVEVVRGLAAMKEAGFRIALSSPPLGPLAGEMKAGAYLVEIPVAGRTLDEVRASVESVGDLRTVAIGVESFTQLGDLKQLGFSHFAGDFLGKPRLLKTRRPSSGRLATLELLRLVHDPDVTIPQLEAVISRDATLGYRLLRWVNSAACGLPRRIDSVQQALVLLGLQKLRALVSMVALASLTDEPKELLTLSLTRARCCELIARRTGADSPDVYFTVGLFSLLDALFGMSMDAILERVPLSERVARALTSGDNAEGRMLAVVGAQERGDFAQVARLGSDPHAVSLTWVESIEWASAAGREMR